MRIVDLLKKEAVVLNAEVSTKEQMLDLLVDLHKEVGNIKDKAAFKAGIMKRESEGPTAIAEGICIPHSKNEAVINPGIAAITVPSGVDCAALDGEPSNLFFMIAAPAEGSDVHLEALSRLSTILMDPAFREKLLSAKDVDAFLAAIDEKETEKCGEEDKAAQAAEAPAKTTTTTPAQAPDNNNGGGNGGGGGGGGGNQPAYVPDYDPPETQQTPSENEPPTTADPPQTTAQPTAPTTTRPPETDRKSVV